MLTPSPCRMPSSIDDVFDVDADAEAECERAGAVRLAVDRALDVDRPVHRVNGARELDQERVSRNLGDAAALPQSCGAP